MEARVKNNGRFSVIVEGPCSIKMTNVLPRRPDVRMAVPTSLEIRKGEQIAIVGENGAGKSMLVDLLMGKYPLEQGSLEYDFSPSPWKEAYKNIRHISFRDTFGSADTNYYYQQRWNSTDLDEVPLVRDLMGIDQTQHDNTVVGNSDSFNSRLMKLFHVEEMLDKPVILLSSGEMRKFQLTKMLLTHPRILILDNPYIGLDAATRDQLTELLMQLSEKQGIQLILVMSMMDSVPDFITHVVVVKDMNVASKMTLSEYRSWFNDVQARHSLEEVALPASKLSSCDQQLSASSIHTSSPNTHFASLDASSLHIQQDEVVRLNKVSIRYGARTILKDLDWVVRRGEKWALSGENGCGKSTLLSIICADNPQSYACDVSLFGYKRGSGESIWDIKKHIGYVSPEMHRAYLKNLPAIDIVASGLHDSIGLYVKPKPEQREVCQQWMETFGIAHLADRPFLQMSDGEQRLVLLARAFVKDPELLILDEPLHGLDTFNRSKVKRIINAFCAREDKTLMMVSHFENELPSCINHRLHLKKII